MNEEMLSITNNFFDQDLHDVCINGYCSCFKDVVRSY